jgi:vancomycin permeability regulator SanA
MQDSGSSPRSRRASGPVGRGIALFVGAFSLLNAVGELVSPGFDANIWWIDLRPMPHALTRALLAIAGVLLAWHGLGTTSPRWRRWATGGVLVPLLVGTLYNALNYYRLFGDGRFQSSFPLPFSLLVAGGLGWILIGLLRRKKVVRRGRAMTASVAVAGLCALLMPLAQMACFGNTDYRQRADAVVVFGARAYADGTPSQALADRVRGGVELYQQGLAPKLIFSGGPGDGAIDEPEAMRRMAVSMGVRDEDILLDPKGVNSQATVDNTLRMFKRIGARRVLAVSHFYHLPRVKMAYQRAGFDVYTVPARQAYVLRSMPKLIVREVAALWMYYVYPLVD